MAETALTLIKQEAPDEYNDSRDSETEFNIQRNGNYTIPTEINAASPFIKTEDCAELPCECPKHQVQEANCESTHVKCESDIKHEDVDCYYETDPHFSMAQTYKSILEKYSEMGLSDASKFILETNYGISEESHSKEFFKISYIKMSKKISAIHRELVSKMSLYQRMLSKGYSKSLIEAPYKTQN